MADKYKRSIKELEKHASMFWPSELSAKEAELSVIPKLLETQDQFIAILSVPVANIEKLFRVISASALPPNLFLKHLIVLADVGGENLQRFNSQFSSLFSKRTLFYIIFGQKRQYKFKAMPVSSLTNNYLEINGKKLLEKKALNDIMKDAISLLLYGANSVDKKTAEILAKCEIGNLLGYPEKLKTFIKQRYIIVSRITSGSKSNNLGQIAQDYVKEYLENKLKIKIKKNGQILGVTHRDADTGKPTTFDLVASNGNKHVAIEVSFQVTTNSVIERKGGQARARYEQIDKGGNKIAYVIDGAGNFQRTSAVSTLCNYSHCTVAFSKRELDLLCNFISEYFKG